MVVLLRASRARRRVPVRCCAPAALGAAGRGISPEAPPASPLLALLAGLLAAADYFDFICSSAWLLPAAAELAAGVSLPPSEELP